MSINTYWNIVEVWRYPMWPGMVLDAKTIEGYRKGKQVCAKPIEKITRPRLGHDDFEVTKRSWHYSFKVLNAGGMEWFDRTPYEIFVEEQPETLKAINKLFGKSINESCLLLYEVTISVTRDNYGGKDSDEEWYFRGILNPERLQEAILDGAK